MKRVAMSILAGGAVLGLAWIAGFDFDQRGIPAFFVTYLAIAACGFAYGILSADDER